MIMVPLSLNDKIDLVLLRQGIILEADDESDKDSTRFIDTSQIDRSAMLQAMSSAGHTVSSLAAAAEVEPSMISRLLREPKRNDPDESARNPSIGLAARVSSELNTSPESLFPDIFNVSRTDLHAKRNKKRDRKGKKHMQRRGRAEYQDGT
jgi:transcriptional regulator with XRE-family HTH domain